MRNTSRPAGHEVADQRAFFGNPAPKYNRAFARRMWWRTMDAGQRAERAWNSFRVFNGRAQFNPLRSFFGGAK